MLALSRIALAVLLLQSIIITECSARDFDTFYQYGRPSEYLPYGTSLNRQIVSCVSSRTNSGTPSATINIEIDSTPWPETTSTQSLVTWDLFTDLSLENQRGYIIIGCGHFYQTEGANQHERHLPNGRFHDSFIGNHIHPNAITIGKLPVDDSLWKHYHGQFEELLDESPELRYAFRQSTIIVEHLGALKMDSFQKLTQHMGQGFKLAFAIDFSYRYHSMPDETLNILAHNGVSVGKLPRNPFETEYPMATPTLFPLRHWNDLIQFRLADLHIVVVCAQTKVIAVATGDAPNYITFYYHGKGRKPDVEWQNFPTLQPTFLRMMDQIQRVWAQKLTIKYGISYIGLDLGVEKRLNGREHPYAVWQKMK